MYYSSVDYATITSAHAALWRQQGGAPRTPHDRVLEACHRGLQRGSGGGGGGGGGKHAFGGYIWLDDPYTYSVLMLGLSGQQRDMHALWRFNDEHFFHADTWDAKYKGGIRELKQHGSGN